jgi:penicillin-binding protein 2
MTEQSDFFPRKNFFFAAVAFIFIIFLGRLIQLQLLYQDVYGKRSEENSIRPIAHDPLRGLIFDRYGKLIVDNRPSYTVSIIPAEFHESSINYLAQILQLDPEFIKDRIHKGKIYNRFAPTKIKRDIDFQTLSLIEENKLKLPGVEYQVESKRFYPTNAKAPHLFGYTKEVSDQQVTSMPDQYRPGDIIGVSGLEASYENSLMGQKGFELITVNAKGQMLGAYNDGKSDIIAKEGNDLFLTLDADLQAFAESLLSDKRGSVVAIDPANGGVLALVSKPDFDLMNFGGVTPADIWNALNADPSKPLFNRATLTRYPPGSTFKMVLAAAALQNGTITTNWRVNCTGTFRFGNRPFKDVHVHGSTNIVEAIQRSCNVFFYQLILKTGFNSWTQMGQEFGFGSTTGIDILEENPGLLPSEEYFDRVYGKGKWTQGYLISLSTGQGEVGVSPLQMACYAATIGSRGLYCKPHVVQQIQDKQTGQCKEISTETRRLDVSREVWDIICEGMLRCVNSSGGTGSAARVPGVLVAGKTGTAQNPHGKDHAWFIGYAPSENPKIAICVLVENAGFGGVVSAPIAGLCIEKYLYKDIIRNKTPQTTLVQTTDDQYQDD